MLKNYKFIQKYCNCALILKPHALYSLLKPHALYSLLKPHALYSLLKPHALYSLLKPHALYSLRPSGSGRQGCGFNPVHSG